MSQASSSFLKRQAAIVSLLVGFVMLALKMSAYFITHSAAILSDALESIVHVAATSMAFYSVILSERPADESHPYGHGKIEFFSAGIEGGLIVVAAVAILYEATRSIVVGRELARLDAGMLLTLGASVVNLALGWFLIRRGKTTGSLTLIADGKHVLTDSWTSFGVVAGLLLVRLTGITLFDPLVAIAVGLNILISGYQLMRVSIGGLMDESDQQTLARVVEIMNRNRTPEWINIHHLRVMRSGQMHHVDFHLTIPYYWNVQQAHAFQERIEQQLAEGLNEQASVLIHLDPCVPSCCRFCGISSCPVRSSPFEGPPKWEVDALIGKPPYTSS
ncbi:MAG TPA: cation diffusion facilitator family transporter [Bacteroidota bacterium]|nr:cation diffusion facilitator family transporter [Bacteroidota bacterium]